MVDMATILREQIYSAVRAFTCATVAGDRHAKRGDCGLDDADSNYVQLDVIEAEPGEQIGVFIKRLMAMATIRDVYGEHNSILLRVAADMGFNDVIEQWDRVMRGRAEREGARP